MNNRNKYSIATFTVLLILFAALFYSPSPKSDAPRILVSVDHSLWNQIGLNRLTYVRALRRVGVQPVLVDYEVMQSQSFSPTALFDNIDGLILSGGGDVDPIAYAGDVATGRNVKVDRDQFELALLEFASQAGIPILGLCRGTQLINVFQGGTLGDFRLDSARYNRHHRIRSGHSIELNPDSRLADIFGKSKLDSVVTYHGQYVDSPGQNVRIVAYADDGTPEAIEVSTGSEFGMLGVQWHAEVTPWDKNQERLFKFFAAAAGKYQAESGN